VSKDYYILDARSCVGNCALWWGPDGKGYVCELDKAGLYTLEDANSHRATDIPVHRTIAEKRAVRHVRWEPLHSAGVGIYDAQSGKRPVVLPAESKEGGA
jgi:hypothetical protein